VHDLERGAEGSCQASRAFKGHQTVVRLIHRRQDGLDLTDGARLHPDRHTSLGQHGTGRAAKIDQAPAAMGTEHHQVCLPVGDALEDYRRR